MSAAEPTTRAQARASAAAPSILRKRIVDGVFVFALLVVSMVPLWSIYQHPAIIVLCAGAIAAAVIISVLATALRWPAYAVVSLTAAAYLLLGVPLAVPGQALSGLLPSLNGLRDLVIGTATSWREMLTVQVPFGNYEALLVPAFIVVLLASVTALSIALGAPKPGWAIIAPLVVLVAGIALGSSAALWPIAAGIAFLVIALAWATVGIGDARARTLRIGGSSRAFALAKLRRFGAAAVVVALCGGAAVAILGVAPPSTDRQVLRTAVTPPFDPRDYVSPLVGFRNEVLPPGSTRELFTVDGLPDGARLRLATLDTYSGLVFTVGTGESDSSGSFERLPYRIDRDASAGERASISVTVDDYSGVWLPTVGDLVSISFSSGSDTTEGSFFVNLATGSAAIVGGVEPGTRYTLDTIVTDQLSDSELAEAMPGNAHQPDALSIPQELIDAVKDHRGSSDDPGAQLVSLADWLRSGYISHSGEDEPFSRPGHSAERLRLLMTEVPMLGDAEQYATALALMAREVGFPSRVVLGYAPAAGQTEITGADTTAWVEVQLADGSWTMVDPTPEIREIPKDDEITTEYIAHPKTVLPPPSTTEDDSISSQSNDDDDTDDEKEAPAWITVVLAVLRIAGIVLLIGLVVTAPFWTIALGLAIRRFRRRRRDRKDGVVTGAWSEVRDAMIDRGYAIMPAATRSEVSALTDSELVRELAVRADEGVFGPGTIDASEVDGYWSAVKKTGKSLDDGADAQARLRTALSLRSLRASVVSWWTTRQKVKP